MTSLKLTCITLTMSFGAAFLLSQCSSPSPATSSPGGPLVVATPKGSVTTQRLGDTTVMTRRLINRPLTNKDIGKVLEEITVVSPSGTSVQERVIVNVAPRLETTNTTKQ